MIAIELAHDLDDAIDRLKVGPGHGAEGRMERLLEMVHLRCEELGPRFGIAASENVSNQRAHALLGPVLHSAITATGTPRFKDSMIRSRLIFAWRAARRASTDRSRGPRAERFRRYPTFRLLLHGVRR
ncbi:MAG: hypothetical protein WAL59_25710, partial [Roseiarcus sp.]